MGRSGESGWLLLGDAQFSHRGKKRKTSDSSDDGAKKNAKVKAVFDFGHIKKQKNSPNRFGYVWMFSVQ